MYLWIALGVLGLAVAGALAWLATLPGEFTVTRRLAIAAEPGRLFDLVADFTSWPKWNPWLLHEPDAALEFSGKAGEVGASYSWDGKRIGAGRLTHTAMDGKRGITQRIEFLRPFRTTSEVGWEFLPAKGGGGAEGVASEGAASPSAPPQSSTEVSWTMRGSMPFLFRFMTKGMEPMIGMDYEAGLLMLARQANPKAGGFALQVQGEERREPFRGLGESHDSGLEQLGELVPAGFARLAQQLAGADGKEAGPSVVAYHRVDLRRMRASFDCVLPVGQGGGQDAPQARSYPGGKYHRVRYTGPYQHLRHAWHLTMSNCRMHRLRPDARRPSYEVYVDMGGEGRPPVTDLCVPLR